jgi:glycosyltransferase involved in cell wall biosynthesis
MNTIPKVSIIMATYNRAHYILQSLQSIQSQTFHDWECLIIDDGGTDSTQDILETILKQDSRFKFYIRTSDYQKGLPGSRNYGLDLAKGDYIIFFDDDDIAHPQNLELCVFELSKSEVKFCRYLREVFFEDIDFEFSYSKEYSSFYIDTNDIEKILKNELPFNSCAVMWKKECFVNNRFIEHLMYAEEWELYSRLILSGINGVSINKCLFYGRKHPNSNTGEFYTDNPIRKKSKKDAILLVINNLKEKKLISNSLLHYFIQISLDYKEYKLFQKIIETVKLSIIENLKWQFFYINLPMRLFFYGNLKKIKNRFNK